MADNFLNSYYKTSQIKIKIALAEVDENANFFKVEIRLGTEQASESKGI